MSSPDKRRAAGKEKEMLSLPQELWLHIAHLSGPASWHTVRALCVDCHRIVDGKLHKLESLHEMLWHMRFEHKT